MVDSFPTISVVICTYNRQAYIVSCLQHLAKQSLPLQQYEVIVVDNCSTDETALLVKHFLHQNSSLPFRYVFEENKGLSYARGRGVAESKSEIILYIDDDAEADEHLLKTFVDFFYQNVCRFFLSATQCFRCRRAHYPKIYRKTRAQMDKPMVGWLLGKG